MSYRKIRFRGRRAMGDGPVTDPSQVDDSIIIGTVGPTRVDCAQLAADSPFRAPGQVCGPTDSGSSIGDILKGLADKFGISSGGAAQPAQVGQPASGAASVAGIPVTTLLLLAAAGGAAYWYATKKKR